MQPFTRENTGTPRQPPESSHQVLRVLIRVVSFLLSKLLTKSWEKRAQCPTERSRPDNLPHSGELNWSAKHNGVLCGTSFQGQAGCGAPHQLGLSVSPVNREQANRTANPGERRFPQQLALQSRQGHAPAEAQGLPRAASAGSGERHVPRAFTPSGHSTGSAGRRSELDSRTEDREGVFSHCDSTPGTSQRGKGRTAKHFAHRTTRAAGARVSAVSTPLPSRPVFGSHLLLSFKQRVWIPPGRPQPLLARELPGLLQGQRGATATRLLYPTCRRHCHAPGGRVLLSEGLKHIQAGNDLSQT